jgi:pilus assembly protein CpaC
MPAAPMRAVALVASLTLLTFTAQAAVTAKAKPASRSQALTSTPCTTTQTVPLINVPLGKSVVLKLQAPASRIIMGNPEGGRAARPAVVTGADKTAKDSQGAATSTSSGVADVDVVLLNPSEIYLLGKSVGSTNIIVLSRTGVCTIMDIAVGVDTLTLESRFNQFLPGSAIKVTAAADSIVLSGMVADATQVDRAMSIASAYSGQGGSSKVINMISVADPQQVMLEVKVAEVSKKLVEKLGAKVNLPKINGSWTYTILTDFLNGSPGSLSASNPSAGKLIEIDAEKRDGLVKILAEPTIMAISGQEGSFLAGGTILIPVDQGDVDGGVALEEKDFGVSLKFTPTVLADGRINLRVKPEVSEVSPEGVGITGGLNGLTRSVLPLIFVRRAETTVQLRDGQSFAIGGLVKNNVVQNMKAFPILGELPIIGALFRSSDFETEKTELVFIITPRLVKPLPSDYRLPTDSYIEPSRAEVFLGGKMEGTPPAAAENPQATSGDTPPAANPPAANPPAASGFELK